MLQVTAQDPLVEGDNVTLKCVADGNPPPTAFNFYLKVHALTNVSLRHSEVASIRAYYVHCVVFLQEHLDS